MQYILGTVVRSSSEIGAGQSVDVKSPTSQRKGKTKLKHFKGLIQIPYWFSTFRDVCVYRQYKATNRISVAVVKSGGSS